MSALRTTLSGFWTRLRARAAGPAYSDRYFWSSVGKGIGARGSALLQQGVREFKAGRGDHAASAVVRHFDSRSTPRFFVDARRVLSADEPSDVRLGAWVRVAAAQTQEAMRDGLLVYGTRVAPLRPGFPWQGRAEGGDDLLVAARPHRLAFAPRMALSVYSGSTSPDELRLLLEDWMQSAGAQPKLPFCSNLVVIQRLIASAWACAFLAAAGESPGCVATRFCLLKIINRDVRFLLPRLGSAFPNNHLLVDRFANWFIALLFPEFRSDRFDLSRIEAGWLEELFNQTYEDGGGFEHSVYYHGMVCEMAAAYLLLSEANDRPVADAVRSRIGTMLRMQAELCGPDGNAPDIGDASDDPMFPLDDGSGGHAAALREICRARFAPQMPALHHDHPGAERAFWLLGGRLAPPGAAVEATSFREYPQSGIAVFLADAEATRCTLRTGPRRGTRHMTGHMHSDFLSVTLTCAGIPFLIDPGTCTYRFGASRELGTSANLRQYFAGPHAHNGFIVGDRDPLGTLTADFRDGATIPAVRHVARAAGKAFAFLEAELTGSAGYPDVARGVIHVPGAGFLVYNVIKEPADAEGVAVGFQFAAGCTIRQASDRQWSALRSGRELALVHSDGLGEARLITGRERPTNGWASPAYGVRRSAPQLILDIVMPNRLTGLGFFPGAGHRATSIACAQPSGDARCFRIETADHCDYVLLNVGPVDTAIAAWGVTFCGRAAWLRVSPRGATRLRWLDGMSCVAPDLGLRHEYDRIEAEFAADTGFEAALPRAELHAVTESRVNNDDQR